MPTALFINGIYEGVLTDILAAQEKGRGTESFLQPYKSYVIRMLRERPPSPKTPVRLYMSTTGNLSNICYAAEIVRWEDKRELADARRDEIGRHLRKCQPGEVELFEGIEAVGKKAVNILTIRNLRLLDNLYSTNLLRKVSDNLPLKKRTRAGGWSEVLDPGDLFSLAAQTQERTYAELQNEITASSRLSDDELARRLGNASSLPERIQVISSGYRRNADVIVAVLRRAKGICEQCRRKAPFLRRSDGSPFLEVHHRISLSDGGQDTTENASALCPNCHRKAHHG